MKPIGMCRALRQGGSPDLTKTAAPQRTSQRAERAIRQSARTRAQPQTNGEAPVKYELTGASGHLRTEARGCGVDQLYASGDALARGWTVFFLSPACHRELTACRNN